MFPESHWQPRIICLCGSTRFRKTFQQLERHLSLAGNLILGLGTFHKRDKKNPQTHAMLCQIHLRKIDLADEILILNVGGYIGPDTLHEIAYALQNNKRVSYLERRTNSAQSQDIPTAIHKDPEQPPC